MATRKASVARVATATALAAILSAALFATGCSAVAGLTGGGVNDQSGEVKSLFAADPAAADWDLEIRSVIAQRKSTGDHMANYTVYLATFKSKKVPGFDVYQSIDVPNKDSMDFKNRVGATFMVVSGGSLLPGVQDPETFMKFYTENFKGKFFLRLQQEIGADGKSTWKVMTLDAAPTESTLTGEIGDPTSVAYDEATKTWSVAK